MYGNIPEHEIHTPLNQYYVNWKKPSALLPATGDDGHIQKQLQREVEKNKRILERLSEATLHLASRNLAFRGKTSNLDDVHNDTFLDTFELLSHYNPLLHEHLEK